MVSGSKRFCEGPEVSPPDIVEIVYAKSCDLVHFGWKMVRNAIHSEFLDTLTTTVPLKMTPGL